MLPKHIVAPKGLRDTHTIFGCCLKMMCRVCAVSCVRLHIPTVYCCDSDSVCVFPGKSRCNTSVLQKFPFEDSICTGNRTGFQKERHESIYDSDSFAEVRVK